jgi:hypothetical protein
MDLSGLPPVITDVAALVQAPVLNAPAAPSAATVAHKVAATKLGKKIEDMVKSKEVYMEKALQTKVLLADKKNVINQAGWEAIREDDKRKHVLEERRIELEEKKAMMELIADENKTMMMDPSIMDAFTREWWDMRREEIMKRRRLARLQSHANGGGTPMGGSGGGAPVGGSGGGGSGGDINVGDA